MDRVAIYYAPAVDDPLWAAGCSWLGRDPARDVPVPQPGFPDIARVTEDARLYGFHATLKPPMRLAPGADWNQVLVAAETMAAAIPPFPLPALRVADLHGFLALRETEPCPALHALADRAVAELDRLRAPAEAAELARRRAAGLSPAQDALLQRWGYPYVFGEWFFHMTLTRRLADTERDAWHARTRDFFAAPLLRARLVSDICLFTQSAPGRAFHLAKRIPLRG